MKKFVLTAKIVLATLFFPLVAQNIETGILQGRVFDAKTNEGIPFAAIVLEQNGIQKGLGQTDDDGNYGIQPIIPGNYEVKVAYLGFHPAIIKNVLIVEGKITFQDVAMEQSTSTLPEIIVADKKMIQLDRTTTGNTLDKSEISHIATRNTNNYASKVAGVFQRDQSTNLNVDGIKMRGSYNPDVTNEEYKTISENKFISVANEPLSTFSIDVDKAAYSNVRRFIMDGTLPPADAVRIEEMINYFTYDYPDPQNEAPFSVTTEISSCPWNEKHKLALIGLQGKKIDWSEVPPNNLVFLIDVSGSMESADKLPLVQSCFRLLVNQLRDEDRVAIVVYAGNAGEVLPSIKGSDKEKILDAIDALRAGGSTAGGEGINLAYEIARENFKPNGNNRVILATDGDFNVGVYNDNDLEHLIEEKRDEGIFLTVLGFGTGNYKDAKMEILADKGNGNYAYIDNLLEGQKVFVKEIGGTMFTIAKDVKLQLEFNPSKVKGYRLIGYENRMLSKEDFNDDKKDAGELGAGHTVTALYEIIPANSDEKIPEVDSLRYQSGSKSKVGEYREEVLNVKLRYKNPKESASKLLSQPLLDREVPLSAMSENFKFASSVAEFGLLLRDSKFKGKATYDQVLNLAKESKGDDKDGYRAEFIRLVDLAKGMNDSGKTAKN